VFAVVWRSVGSDGDVGFVKAMVMVVWSSLMDEEKRCEGDEDGEDGY
jgi:hypothetical protein